MRFGIFDHMERRDEPPGVQLENRLQMLEFADAAGYWCYHKAEHHFTVLDIAPSSNVFLAAASQRTSNIRFGPMVYLLPFYDPLRLVEEICVLDHLSGGRLEIGVGRGISPVEHQLWGNAPAESRVRFEEAFTVLREGLTSSELTHRGEYFTHENLPMVLAPQQGPRPPFWYPGNVDYAGQHRLNTITGGPAAGIAKSVSKFRQLVKDAAEDWNPGVAEPTIGATCHLYVGETDELARQRVRSAFQRYHQNLTSLWARYDEPLPGGGPTLGGDVDLALKVGALVAGSPDSVAAHIRELADAADINYFIGAFAWGDLSHTEAMASLRLFADEVMPRF